MAITLNYRIVLARDKEASGKFSAALSGSSTMAPKVTSRRPVNETLTLDFDNWDHFETHHYAFHVSDAEFDAIFGRIKKQAFHMKCSFYKEICKPTTGAACAASI